MFLSYCQLNRNHYIGDRTNGFENTDKYYGRNFHTDWLITRLRVDEMKRKARSSRLKAVNYLKFSTEEYLFTYMG